MTSARRDINLDPPPRLPFSHAVRAGGLIFLSGTIAVDGTGAIVGRGDVGAQTRWILERMRAVLEAAGSSLDGVVSSTVYLTSAADFGPMNDAYRPFWSRHPPTRTTVITRLVVPDALVEIGLVAVPSAAGREVIHPARWAPSPNPYSYAIRTEDVVFLAGLVPRRPADGSLVEGDVSVQTRALLDNAADLLAAAGLTFEHVVSARVYLTDARSFGGMNSVYAEAFARGFPARATVQAGLPGSGIQVEMTFTASVPPRTVVGAPPAGVPISPAVRAGGRLYLSGALGNTPETAGDVAAQTRETLERLRKTLALAGASPRDVVDATVYLTDAAGFSAMNEAYRAFFEGARPARATVVTPLVAPDGLVEILMTAVPSAPA